MKSVSSLLKEEPPEDGTRASAEAVTRDGDEEQNSERSLDEIIDLYAR